MQGKYFATIVGAVFLSACNTTSVGRSGDQRDATAAALRAEGKTVIEAPSSGKDVTVRTKTTQFDLPFPLWDGKRWRHQINYDGGSWPMEVTVRIRDGSTVVLEMFEPAHGNRSSHPARSRECIYSPEEEKITGCRRIN